RLQRLLFSLRQAAAEELERDAAGGTERDREADPGPHPPQRVPPPFLTQERGDDPDDQERFDALAEADDEGREHQAGRLNSGSPCTPCKAHLTNTGGL